MNNFFILSRSILPALMLAALLSSSCATVHVWASNDSDSAENTCTTCHTTSWAFAWGIVQPTPVKADCLHKAVSRVRVKTNLGYALITTMTLGIAIPQYVEWDCAPQDVPTGDFGQ